VTEFALRSQSNIQWQPQTITRRDRVRLMGHQPAVLWFTGLSGAGKSTIANLVEAALHARGIHTAMLDGDNVRHGLNQDLGFTESCRVENIRRIGHVARLMTDAGLIVLCAFISPFRADRRLARDLIADGEFIEIFVDAPLDLCIARDPKGLYKRALAGEIRNFTGLEQRYEPPDHPALHLHAGLEAATDLAEAVMDLLCRLEIV
jgi:bifunctional enzyme CysN/CysC